MDWFEQLMGFREGSYESTQNKMEIRGKNLHSLVNEKSYGIGQLELLSLQELRERVANSGGLPGQLKISVLQSDARKLHQHAEFNGALFQVASQFNLLEMVSPRVTPEDGVTRYENDPTQGPACAIAAGAATIFRNYFAPVGDQVGQTAKRQLNGLADLGAALSVATETKVDGLWSMSNGYALCTQDGLQRITRHLDTLSPQEMDELRGLLRVGVHWNVEVTDSKESVRPHVSQAYCSALPVAYSSVPSIHWKSFASLILEAAYEATMLAGVLNAQRGASNIVLLTRIGGGAFGNDGDWIHDAMRRAFSKAEDFDLDVRIVTYSNNSAEQLTNLFVRETKHMDIIWDGITRIEVLNERAADARSSLADAAKAYDWPQVLKLATEHKDLINSCRPGEKSLFAPLHQAAHAGAPVEIVRRLIELGAWRTLQNARGERPVDVAERKGHSHLRETLEPVLKHSVPIGILLKIQSHFHDVIRSRIDRQLPDHGLRLPELEPLLEIDSREMWFPVPGMYGGFSYRLESIGADAKLVSESWCRVEGGSGQRHEITTEGGRLVEEGFV